MAGLLGPVMGQQLAARLGLLDAPEESQQRDPRFWRGGEKVRGKDALAGLLAVIGDSASQLAGGQGGAIEGLLGGRSKALDEFKKRAEQERKMQELTARMRAAGLSDAQIDAELGGFKLPEQEKPPAIGQNLDYFMQNILPDEKRMAAFKQYQDIVSPYRFMGADGVPGQMNSAPDFLTEEEMAKLGGGTGNGAGGFRFR